MDGDVVTIFMPPEARSGALEEDPGPARHGNGMMAGAGNTRCRDSMRAAHQHGGELGSDQKDPGVINRPISCAVGRRIPRICATSTWGSKDSLVLPQAITPG